MRRGGGASRRTLRWGVVGMVVGRRCGMVWGGCGRWRVMLSLVGGIGCRIFGFTGGRVSDVTRG